MAVRQKGTKWQVDVTVGGVRAPRVSCDTQTEARKVEAEFKAKMLAGASPESLAPTAQQARVKGTLGGLLMATYQSRWVGSKSEATSYRNADSWCLELGEGFELSCLTPAVVADTCDKWALAGNKSSTINRKLAALSVMLGVAVERGLMEKAFRLPRRKEYEGRLRFYSDAEVTSLIDFVEGDIPMRNLFILAVETGMRQGELLGLTKRDVNLDLGVITLGRTKGNKRRAVPLTTRAQRAAHNMIKQQGMRDHDKLFPEHVTAGHISRRMRNWKHAMGLPEGDEACFHTFRHTTCSRLMMRGVPLNVVKDFMGHAAIQTTMRYAHLAPNSLAMARDALERTPT